MLCYNVTLFIGICASHRGARDPAQFGTVGRFIVKATWAELVALYRLAMDAAPHNLRPRYNVCPTDPVDVVTGEDGEREAS
jgi:hypothetical protein